MSPSASDTKSKKPFRVHGADGKVIEIPPGEFYINVKDRAKRMMLNSLSSDARRVYACLELATVGFQRELAVKQNSEKKIVPLKPHDVIRMTELSPRRFRLSMDELDRAGLGKRVCDDEKGLRKGHVRLYSWAVPRPAVKPKIGERASSFPSWFPVEDKTLKSLVKHLKLKLFPELDEEARVPFLAKLDEEARRFENARIGVMRLLESVSAPREKRAYKKTTDTTKETTGAAAPSDTSINDEGSSSSSSSSEKNASASPEPPATTTTTATPRLETETPETPEPERMPDAKFGSELCRVFVDAKRDAPSRSQIRETVRTLPDHPLAPQQFLYSLTEGHKPKIERIDHPGALPVLVDSFNNGWEHRLEKLTASAPRSGEDPADRLVRLQRQYAESPKADQAMYRETFPNIKFEDPPAEKAAAAGAEEPMSPFERAEKEARRGKNR